MEEAAKMAVAAAAAAAPSVRPEGSAYVLLDVCGTPVLGMCMEEIKATMRRAGVKVLSLRLVGADKGGSKLKASRGGREVLQAAQDAAIIMSKLERVRSSTWACRTAEQAAAKSLRTETVSFISFMEDSWFSFTEAESDRVRAVRLAVHQLMHSQQQFTATMAVPAGDLSNAVHEASAAADMQVRY